MNIFLAPASKENLLCSIEKPITIETLSNSNFTKEQIEFLQNKCIDGIHAWAITNNRNMLSYINNIKPDDIIIFCDNSSKKFTYICKVVCLINNKLLNSNLWDKHKNTSIQNKWCNIIFVTNITKINPPISKLKIMTSIKSKYTLQTFYKLKSNEKKLFLATFSELLCLFERSTITKKDEVAISAIQSSNNSVEPIRNLLNFIDKKPIINLNLNKPKEINNIKNKSNFIQTRKIRNSNILSDSDKKLIGLLGEKYSYEYLLLNKEQIISLIKPNFKICKINWFNSEIDITQNQWIDQSIGHGFDIEIYSEEKKLKFEIKTSFNKINEVTFSRNELLEMKNSLATEDYFLIFVSNLKNIMHAKDLELFILNNFTKNISFDYILCSKEHTFFAQELIKRYKIFI